MDVKQSKVVRATRVAVADAIGGTVFVVGLIVAAPAAFAAPPGASCQPFASKPCLLPFPNNLYTVKDPSSVTGRRVHLPRRRDADQHRGQPDQGRGPTTETTASAPAATSSSACPARQPRRPPTDESRPADRHVGGVQTERADRRHRRPDPRAAADLGGARLQRARCGEHHAPHPPRQELHRGAPLHRRDAQPEEPERERRSKPRPGSSCSGMASPLPPAEQSQKARYDSIFKSLQQAGIQRGNLYMAWDFTVMSRRSLSSRMLHIRNRAFLQLGDANLADGIAAGQAPAFQVTSQEDFTPAEDPRVMRIVKGTFQVPCYLTTDDCAIGGGFHYSSANAEAPPTQKPGNMATAPFQCIIPQAAASNPARASLYGHGLLGSCRRGRGREREGHGVGARLDVLRDGLVGAVGRRRPLRHHGASGPEQVPAGDRPAAAGCSQHPLPRPADEDRPTGSRRMPPSRMGAASPSSTPRTSTTTGTARAGSWAA